MKLVLLVGSGAVGKMLVSSFEQYKTINESNTDSISYKSIIKEM